jgi:hypothetical protein
MVISVHALKRVTESKVCDMTSHLIIQEMVVDGKIDTGPMLEGDMFWRLL